MLIITAWQCVSSEGIVKGPMQWMRLMMILCGMTEEDGDIRSEFEEDEGLNVKMETVTLIGKGRYNVTWFVY